MSIERIDYLSASNIFPTAYGNEEETGMMENVTGQYNEPFLLVREYGSHIPEALQTGIQFLKNGFKVYPGGGVGALSPTNLERATPECLTPRELVAYTRASEQLAVKIAESYALHTSAGLDSDVKVRIQRRVVDSDGTRKGCHDNFGVSYGSTIGYELDDSLVSLFKLLGSRSFITGAGYVKKNNLDFAQKINGLIDTKGYGYFGTMYRYTEEEGSGRLEVRCNDANISEWATWIRIGSVGLLTAIIQTPLKDDLSPPNDFNAIDYAKKANRLKLRADGTIATTPELRQSVDFIKRLAEIGLDKLQLYVDDIPMEYFEIASELLKYCDDFDQVLKGNSAIDLLSDRADWAAKFVVIQRKIERDKAFGIRRTLNDIESAAMDMKYDHISIGARQGVLQKTNYGYGYKLRNRNLLRPVVKENDITRAVKQPPMGTRARIRSQLLRQYSVSDASWHYVSIYDDELKATIKFPNVRQTSISAVEQSDIDRIKKKAI